MFIVSSAVKILRLDFQINRTSIKNSKNLVIKNPTKETTVEGTLTDLVYWHVLIRSTSKLAWFAYLTLFPLERYTFYHLDSMYIKWQSLEGTGLIKPMNTWFLKMNHVFRLKVFSSQLWRFMAETLLLLETTLPIFGQRIVYKNRPLKSHQLLVT